MLRSRRELVGDFCTQQIALSDVGVAMRRRRRRRLTMLSTLPDRHANVSSLSSDTAIVIQSLGLRHDSRDVRLSVSEHVQSVISKCAQSMHALKILRSHSMSSDALKVIYKSVVLTKLLRAMPQRLCSSAYGALQICL